MKTPTAKVELACGKRDRRFYLNQPYLDADRKCIVSANGHILAVVKVETHEGDTAGAIPLDALKRARAKGQNGCIALNGSAVAGDASFPRPDVGNFIDYMRAVPQKPDREPDITLDAEALFNLARAVSEGKRPVVSLWITGKESAVYVEPYSGDSFGVIMPCRRR